MLDKCLRDAVYDKESDGVKDGVKACESPIRDQTKHLSLPYFVSIDTRM